MKRHLSDSELCEDSDDDLGKQWERSKKKLIYGKAAKNYLQDTLNYVRKSPLNSNQVSSNNCVIVYFDLETGGFRMGDDILQISAKCNDDIFDVYVKPTKEISPKASEVNKMSVFEDELYVKNKKVDAEYMPRALNLFSKFLKKQTKPVLLVAHNGLTFDGPRLLQAILKNKMMDRFKMVVGFSDTRRMLKKKLPQRQGNGAFKLSKLTATYLNTKDSEDFHCAVYDVTILQKLIRKLGNENDLYDEVSTLENMLVKIADATEVEENLAEFKKQVSDSIIKKMKNNGFTFDSMLDTYKNEGEEKLLYLLTKQGKDKKPLVTKNQKSLDKILKLIKNYADGEIHSE